MSMIERIHNFCIWGKYVASDARGSQESWKFIFLEYYIIEEGLMWNSILEILEEKAAQGVEVKLLYDDIGCISLA